MSKARLILVGAGPGDPELITVKALEAIRQADYILYDSLVNLRILDLAGRDINDERLIYVGKRRGESSKQGQINELILRLLQQNKVVLRLKGGDPFVFARGAEEIELAASQGFPYEIIPGLTSALGLASMHSISLTLREKSDSVTLVTGHEINPAKLDLWSQILKTGSTLVVYMGLGNVVELCQGLEENLAENIPAIAIASGGLMDEKIIYSDLKKLAQDIIDEQLASPTLLYFGKNIQAIHYKNIKNKLTQGARL